MPESFTNVRVCEAWKQRVNREDRVALRQFQSSRFSPTHSTNTSKNSSFLNTHECVLPQITSIVEGEEHSPSSPTSSPTSAPNSGRSFQSNSSRSSGALRSSDEQCKRLEFLEQSLKEERAEREEVQKEIQLLRSLMEAHLNNSLASTFFCKLSTQRTYMIPSTAGERKQMGVLLNFLLRRLTSRAHRRMQLFLVACWIIFIFFSFLQFQSDLTRPKNVPQPPIVLFPHKEIVDSAIKEKDFPQQNTNTNHATSGIIPVVIFAYQRDEYLRKCLDRLLGFMPTQGFRIFVSQDGDHQGVAAVANSFGDRVTLFQRERNIILPQKIVGNPSYYSIAQHYKFGIQKVFDADPNFRNIIILEEDIEIAPDFFDYFAALAPILEQDNTLMCASAWNDNGMEQFVQDPYQLYRSDFFPGLGWMMTKKLWDEVAPQWPLGYWDDWLREPQVRKGRACIRPEISRTYTFGAKGVSMGQFYEKYLKHIRLNTVPVKWLEMDLSYLHKSKYDKQLIDKVNAAESIHVDNREQYAGSGKDLKAFYSTANDFEYIADRFGVMTELKAGVPRGAYGGVVGFRWKDNQIFITPQSGPMKPITYSNDPPFTPR